MCMKCGCGKKMGEKGYGMGKSVVKTKPMKKGKKPSMVKRAGKK